MARITAIVNPVAGGGQSAKRWERLAAAMRDGGLEFDWYQTEGPADGVRLAARAMDAGAPMLVAVGGDGTISEVAHGIMLTTGGQPSDVRLGIIPTGRGTDYCRTLGIPLDGAGAVGRLFGERTLRVDLGELEYTTGGVTNRRYFTNFAGLGFDVEVTRRANASRRGGGGTIPYLSAVFLSLLQFKKKRVELVLDGEVERRRIATIVVANGQYFGGGMRVAPHASLVDGLFDVVILGEMGRLELIVNVPRVYEGTHISHPKVDVRRAGLVEVHSVDPLYVQVDGDPLGETPVRVRVLKSALAVAV